ncbi:MAG: hypothetical protein ACXW1N_03745 [Halobacteriota archaeon]
MSPAPALRTCRQQCGRRLGCWGPLGERQLIELSLQYGRVCSVAVALIACRYVSRPVGAATH